MATRRASHAASGTSARTLPGDEVLPNPDLVMDRVLHLSAPPTEVWPWLEQLGRCRGGWYLPRYVERLVPRGRRGLRHVDEDLLGLSVGDEVPDWGPRDPSFRVLQLKVASHLVYWSERPRSPRRGQPRPSMRMTWALVLTEEDRGATLHLRLRLDLGHRAGPLPRYGGGAIDWLSVVLLGQGLNERFTAKETR